jgi:hypothetical protein
MTGLLHKPHATRLPLPLDGRKVAGAELVQRSQAGALASVTRLASPASASVTNIFRAARASAA